MSKKQRNQLALALTPLPHWPGTTTAFRFDPDKAAPA